MTKNSKSVLDGNKSRGKFVPKGSLPEYLSSTVIRVYNIYVRGFRFVWLVYGPKNKVGSPPLVVVE